MLYQDTRKKYLKNLIESENSINAYIATIDCKSKTVVEISDESFKYLENDFEEIFFSENHNSKALLKNTVKFFGVLASLGGSYSLSLQRKHYEDLYESLYRPKLESLKSINDETNRTLNSIGTHLCKFNAALIAVQKILKSNTGAFSPQTVTTPQGTLKQLGKFSAGCNLSLNAGFGGLVGGSTALGAWGVVSIIGSASTGTAISTLSGVAATNATLAWFGGGSLAAGGTGMAGGFWILGGIVAAPIVYFLSKSSYEKVNKIKEQKVELISEIERVISIEPEARKQMMELKRHSELIIEIINEFMPQILHHVSFFNKSSSFFYRIFGGKLNEDQLDAYDQLNKLSSDALLRLGVTHN